MLRIDTAQCPLILGNLMVAQLFKNSSYYQVNNPMYPSVFPKVRDWNVNSTRSMSNSLRQRL
jgi:hypothetical protein